MSAVRFERIGAHYDDFLVSLIKYDQHAVDVIKSLPHWTRSWDPMAQVWRIHPGYAEPLAASLRRIGCTIVGLDDQVAA